MGARAHAGFKTLIKQMVGTPAFALRATAALAHPTAPLSRGMTSPELLLITDQ
jgi:hypothetical protein